MPSVSPGIMGAQPCNYNCPFPCGPNGPRLIGSKILILVLKRLALGNSLKSFAISGSRWQGSMFNLRYEINPPQCGGVTAVYAPMSPTNFVKALALLWHSLTVE